MKTIVVGVDSSETAEAAALTAARIAQKTGATLITASAYGKAETDRIQVGSEQHLFSHEGEALDTAKSSATRVQQEFPDVQVVPRAVRGKPAEALVDLAASEEADLIVVGNKRVQGLARVLGSIAADVARTAPCDVYIAHTH